MKVCRPKTSHARRQDGDWSRLTQEVERLRTVDEVDAYWGRFLLYRLPHYPEPWSLALKDLCAEQRRTLLDLESRNHAMDAEYRTAMERHP